MAKSPPKQPSPGELATRILTVAARLAFAMADTGEEEDVLLFALYIHVRNAEERIRTTYQANRTPGMPSFFEMRKHMQKIADELRQSVHKLARDALPGLDDMTEEQVAQVLELLQVDPGDLPKA